MDIPGRRRNIKTQVEAGMSNPPSPAMENILKIIRSFRLKTGLSEPRKGGFCATLCEDYGGLRPLCRVEGPTLKGEERFT